MDGLERFLETVTEEERLEIVHLMWLYVHAREPARRKATERLDPLLARNDVAREQLMAAVREASEGLRGFAE